MASRGDPCTQEADQTGKNCGDEYENERYDKRSHIRCAARGGVAGIVRNVSLKEDGERGKETRKRTRQKAEATTYRYSSNNEARNEQHEGDDEQVERG